MKWAQVHFMTDIMMPVNLYGCATRVIPLAKKVKMTFYAEGSLELLNQPLRYYQETKDRTMQAEDYGARMNAGLKINF